MTKKTETKSAAVKKTRKAVVLPQTLHDDFLKIAAQEEQDFQKRVRWLIKHDVETNKHLLKK